MAFVPFVLFFLWFCMDFHLVELTSAVWQAIFVVVIPWQGSEEDVFARCTNLLRDAEPMAG